MNGVSGLLVAFSLSGLMHNAVATSVFVRRRHTFPIDGHSIGLILMSMVGIGLQGLCSSISESFGGRTPCVLEVLLRYLGVVMTTIAWVARAWRVWFRYLYASAKVYSQASLQEHESLPQWCQKYGRYFSDFSLNLIVASTTTFVWLTLIVAFFVVAGDDPGVMIPEDKTERCPAMMIPFRVIMGWIGLNIILISFTLWKLRNTRENYGIKRDLAQSLGLAVLCIIFAHLEPMIGHVITLVSFTIFAHLYISTLVTWKVIRSFREERKTSRGRSARKKKKGSGSPIRQNSVSVSLTNIENLSDVLKDPQVLALFIEHLKREFSVENILFYRRIRSFKETYCDGDVLESIDAMNCAAASIFVDFISRDAEFQINLSAKQFRKIQAEMNRCFPNFDAPTFRRLQECPSDDVVAETIFDDAERTIYELMENDSFPRFKRGPRKLSVIVPSPSNMVNWGSRVTHKDIQGSVKRLEYDV